MRRLSGVPVAAIVAWASISAWGAVAPPSPVTGLRLGPIGTGEAALVVLIAEPAGTSCEGRLKGTFSILGGAASAAVEAAIVPSPGGGCEIPLTLRFDAVSADVLERVKLDAFDYRLSGDLGSAEGTRQVDWQGRLPWNAVRLAGSAKATLGRYVKVHDVAMGSVGFTRTTVNVSVDVFVPFRFDLRILEASCAVEVNGRDVAAGKREKVLLHAGQSSRMEIPVTFENGAVLAAAGKTMAKKGKLEGRLKGIGRLKLPGGELDFPFDLPILISLL